VLGESQSLSSLLVSVLSAYGVVALAASALVAVAVAAAAPLIAAAAAAPASPSAAFAAAAPSVLAVATPYDGVRAFPASCKVAVPLLQLMPAERAPQS